MERERVGFWYDQGGAVAVAVAVSRITDQLRDELLAFRKERDWEQFHNLRTLSTSIALEAAERGVPQPTSFRRHRPDASGRPCGRASSFGHPAPAMAG
ncbi:MAG: hypothetical protein IPM12_08965 [Flavobacteriales bacterium]|nr:hypothetical protein [Flavobacteriales bacterium]